MADKKTNLMAMIDDALGDGAEETWHTDEADNSENRIDASGDSERNSSSDKHNGDYSDGRDSSTPTKQTRLSNMIPVNSDVKHLLSNIVTQVSKVVGEKRPGTTTISTKKPIKTSKVEEDSDSEEEGFKSVGLFALFGKPKAKEEKPQEKVIERVVKEPSPTPAPVPTKKDITSETPKDVTFAPTKTTAAAAAEPLHVPDFDDEKADRKKSCSPKLPKESDKPSEKKEATQETSAPKAASSEKATTLYIDSKKIDVKQATLIAETIDIAFYYNPIHKYNHSDKDKVVIDNISMTDLCDPYIYQCLQRARTVSMQFKATRNSKVRAMAHGRLILQYADVEVIKILVLESLLFVKTRPGAPKIRIYVPYESLIETRVLATRLKHNMKNVVYKSDDPTIGMNNRQLLVRGTDPKLEEIEIKQTIEHANLVEKIEKVEDFRGNHCIVLTFLNPRGAILTHLLQNQLPLGPINKGHKREMCCLFYMKDVIPLLYLLKDDTKLAKDKDSKSKISDFIKKKMEENKQRMMEEARKKAAGILNDADSKQKIDEARKRAAGVFDDAQAKRSKLTDVSVKNPGPDAAKFSTPATTVPGSSPNPYKSPTANSSTLPTVRLGSANQYNVPPAAQVGPGRFPIPQMNTRIPPPGVVSVMRGQRPPYSRPYAPRNMSMLGNRPITGRFQVPTTGVSAPNPTQTPAPVTTPYGAPAPMGIVGMIPANVAPPPRKSAAAPAAAPPASPRDDSLASIVMQQQKELEKLTSIITQQQKMDAMKHKREEEDLQRKLLLGGDHRGRRASPPPVRRRSPSPMERNYRDASSDHQRAAEYADRVRNRDRYPAESARSGRGPPSSESSPKEDETAMLLKKISAYASTLKSKPADTADRRGTERSYATPAYASPSQNTDARSPDYWNQLKSPSTRGDERGAASSTQRPGYSSASSTSSSSYIPQRSGTESSKDLDLMKLMGELGAMRKAVNSGSSPNTQTSPRDSTDAAFEALRQMQQAMKAKSDNRSPNSGGTGGSVNYYDRR